MRRRPIERGADDPLGSQAVNSMSSRGCAESMQSATFSGNPSGRRHSSPYVLPAMQPNWFAARPPWLKAQRLAMASVSAGLAVQLMLDRSTA